MPFNKSNEILDKHLPGRMEAASILSRLLPEAALANAVMHGAGIWRGPHFLPAEGRVGTGKPPIRTLPKVIADNAKAVTAAGGVVDIRVWAAGLSNEGVTIEQIGAAYQGAGGDAVLAPAEAKGDTSAFLHDFVAGLQGQGVPDEVIAGTYQNAGGKL